jgi:hypothetical protein
MSMPYNNKLDVYVGRTKTWQAIPDFYGKEQVNKIQMAIQAPLQEQLDEWERENDSKFLQLPINNENVHKYRDQPEFKDNLDHDYDSIIYERQKKQVYEQLRNSRFESLLDKYQKNNFLH